MPRPATRIRRRLAELDRPLSAIAAATERLRLVGAAIIAPLRHPLLLAHELAALDLLSDGRLVVQPTVSWHRDEYEALGVPFEAAATCSTSTSRRGARRGRRRPRRSTAATTPSTDVYLEPKPFRPDGPRIWFGGATWRRLLRRLVDTGDGLHPFGQPTDEQIAPLRAAMAAAGRDFAELEIVGGIAPRFPDDAQPRRPRRGAEAIPAQLEAGFTTICFKPSMFTDDPARGAGPVPPFGRARGGDGVSRRPRIAITPWRRVVPTYLAERTVLDALDPAYSERVADAGALPMIVPRAGASAAEALDGFDGLLLSGGGDVDPSTYGAAPENVADADPAADAWELELVGEARSRALPVLGVCRGAQLLAVAAGGRLAQRLPAVAAHRDIAELTPEEILAERHPVELAEGSRVRAIFGAGRVDVNTIHHHAIADAGTLAVTGRAAGGLVEAIEGDGPFLVGVQWHPEKMSEPDQRLLFEAFVRSTATP